ncbi:hypothetical protein PHMEG_00025891 [Phytophthora megakarya]|uniref:Uncharacterized protein n=1 Tax=Phytophthora megakarya TaxID=4795 RepID=A0A225VBR9_9STRA|nr:hypothetical protein PHMEG_00025891 [Phytophthora megakarya]
MILYYPGIPVDLGRINLEPPDWRRVVFQYKLVCGYGSMDHCDAIAASFHKVWPDIKLLNCWSHLLLERSRSEGQFVALSKTITENWRVREWLEEQYLSYP